MNSGKTALAILLLAILAADPAGGLQAQGPLYGERHRPQYHFSPEKNWMNDPNGLVYHRGEYHLFYQHNPFGNTWGHMSWGHAVSRDLVHWQHLPVALEEENGIMIFSGSAVVDRHNSSGLGTPGNPPMVAIYTGHHTEGKLQDQRIAYSLDNGRSWTKYRGNPVLDEGLADFRDPKVFWHEDTQKWIMAVALSTVQKVRFYGSENLKEWTLLSEFGPAGAAGDRLWECPELFALPVEGAPGERKWVLQVDVNPGAVAGGSGAQYFVGEFDGRRFTEDPSRRGTTLWVDYGRDFYAAQSFSNIPEDDGRRIWLAWMNNWDYANRIPTSPWRSAMTVPREAGLKKTADGYRLTQQPVRELKKLRGEHSRYEDRQLPAGDAGPITYRGGSYEIEAVFEAGEAEAFGFKIGKGGEGETTIGYRVEEQQLFVDRRMSGDVDFDSTFASLEEAPMQAEGGRVKLHLLVDRSSVEVFGQDGETVITDRIFPAEGGDGLQLFSEGGPARLVRMDIWELKSIWNGN